MTSSEGFYRALDDARDRMFTTVRRVPLDALAGWTADPATGTIRHHAGRFFTVEGVRVDRPGHPVDHWSQPIIDQPEIGILGILVKEFDGVPHYLMQLKAEPGNCDGIQVSPTVQATRSNYLRVHGGKPVPYLDYFRDPSRHRVVADVRQSEQGAWFLRKRNRNMVVEVRGEVELHDGFHWLSLPQLHRLLAQDDLVNMDTRSVLACLPLAEPEPEPGGERDEFTMALLRSCRAGSPTHHTERSLLSWITDTRVRADLAVSRVPLSGLPGWRRTEGRISHESGRFFDVIGVQVTASGREVARWDQPMIAPHGMGVVGLLVTRIDGVLHALVQLRAEVGYVDAVELAPTLQCVPENYDVLPAAARPPLLDEVLGAPASAVRFDTVQSEEGGRFYHARTRHLIVETPYHPELAEHPDFRWMTPHQLSALLRHSHYVSMETRSLLACLRSLATAPRPVGVR
ncbi:MULTISPECIES: NDP-hexose 2,3-dehydratase family protein [Streptomyces]|uniref:NDP-hexose 2,3-dehydratase family protein n=1 Tax=Streptomyces TaxID=1883 RepID=UPI000756EC05|nr:MULTISPECIES: NDP-hexose 2,3-dehydratase family protein [Streptomyces]MDX6758055.1 NDP-hexose 2,3-dehydratase family protein [Streptomyces sp. F8]